jgi:meso-butanediol dehydrogenase / (S,S)-butanediol dehydrogenase / diacetyl reductase
MQRYAGKSVIVTGAANGIGAATARRLAAEGASLFLVDLSDAVDVIATEIGALSLCLDLATDGAPATVAAEVAERVGKVDLLVNNAGIGGSRAFEDADDAFLDRLLSVNLRAVFRVTRHLLPHLRRPGASIVNIGSTLGLAGHPGTSAYAVTKGAIAQLTRQLAAEYGPEGIRVNAVAPGVIETQMTRERVHGNDFYQRAFIACAPIRGYGQPEDIAAAIAFLGSEDARFISAQVLPVDGGWTDARHPPKEL